MRKFHTGVSVSIVAALWVTLWGIQINFKAGFRAGETDPGERNEKDRKEMLKRMYEEEWERTHDPATGRVPRERLYQAYAYASQLRNSRESAISGVTWTERGPDNVGGRTRAILVDPNDVTKKTVWSAGVSGGLWKTTDITQASPSWTAVNDFFTNLAITCMAHDPSNTNVMYFGTGEGYNNSDAVDGDGIWKTTDGGANWTQLAATASNSNFVYCRKMAVTSGGVILVATYFGGVQRSTNGGTTWTKVLGTGLGITGATSNSAWDVVIAANGDVYASLQGSIHKSTNAGATFGSAMTVPITLGRSDLAVAPNDANYVYAIVELSNVVNGIIRTTNAGTSWASRTEPADADAGVPASDFSNGQAWYDMAIAVDPNNRDRLWVGGLNIFVSSDGASTWTQVMDRDGNFSLQYVHADQHAIVYEPGNSNVVYFGNDGGIWRTTNGAASVPTITDKIQNYNVTQFYAVAAHPDSFSNHFLAGAQDNGTQKFSDAGINSTVEVTSGDGAWCHIDQDQPQFQWSQYIFNQYFRSTNGGISFGSIISVGNTGFFINRSDYDNTANKMYAAHNSDTYLRWDDPQTGSSFVSVSTGTAFGGGKASAIRVSPVTANKVFFGTTTARCVACTGANATPTCTNISSASFPAGATVSCVEVDPANENHILLTFSNYGVNSVWRTTNGGSTWTSIEGNLPDMPIRWIVFNPNNTNQAMVATELGVWTCDNITLGGSCVWGTSNSGLANVRVDMLKVRNSDKVVVAATHGRGLFTSDVFANPAAQFSATPTLTYTGKTVQFNDESTRATSWLWNFGDGNTSTSRNPTHTYATGGKYTITLAINGGAVSRTRTQYVHILPDRGTPYTPAAGGNFDTAPDDFGSQSILGGVNLWERGVPTNQLSVPNTAPNVWKTDLDADVTPGTYQCALQTPSYNFSAAGSYFVKFRRAMEVVFCNGPFALQVQYSTNKGNSWTRLGTQGDPLATNWYSHSSTVTTCGGGTPLMDNSIFADQTGYMANRNTVGAPAQATYDVSFLAGQTDVAFRFLFSVIGGFSATGYLADGFLVDDFEITGPANSASSLSAETVVLSGIRQNAGVQLAWETHEENGLVGFTLERSRDGEAFTEIGYVPASMYSSALRNYNHFDPEAGPGNLRYRLRMTDADGNVTRSNEVLIGPLEQSMNLWPNPARDGVFLQSEITFSRIQMFDASGREVKVDVRDRSADGSVHITWNAPLVPGVYFLRMRDRSGVQIRKVIVN